MSKLFDEFMRDANGTRYQLDIGQITTTETDIADKILNDTND